VVAVVSCLFVVVSTLCLIISTLPMFQQKDSNGIVRESIFAYTYCTHIYTIITKKKHFCEKAPPKI
jgi:hypothetical protein